MQYIDLRTRFLLIQSTTDVTNTINMAKSSLKKNRDKFLAALLESQATLNEDIKSLKNQINKLMTYKSIDQLEEAASLSNTCQKILQDCQERAKVCNSREVNFNREQTKKEQKYAIVEKSILIESKQIFLCCKTWQRNLILFI